MSTKPLSPAVTLAAECPLNGCSLRFLQKMSKRCRGNVESNLRLSFWEWNIAIDRQRVLLPILYEGRRPELHVPRHSAILGCSDLLAGAAHIDGHPSDSERQSQSNAESLIPRIELHTRFRRIDLQK